MTFILEVCKFIGMTLFIGLILSTIATLISIIIYIKHDISKDKRKEDSN